jgi:hypothetical protein
MWTFMFWNLPIHNIMLFYTFFNHLESLPAERRSTYGCVQVLSLDIDLRTHVCILAWKIHNYLPLTHHIPIMRIFSREESSGLHFLILWSPCCPAISFSSGNQPCGFENHVFTFINVSKKLNYIYIYLCWACQSVSAATRARCGCGLRYCVWILYSNTQFFGNIIWKKNNNTWDCLVKNQEPIVHVVCMQWVVALSQSSSSNHGMAGWPEIQKWRHQGHIYIYIYIYRERKRVRERER